MEEQGKADLGWMRIGVASVWIATGVLVVHPYYREVGAGFLTMLGLPHWLQIPVCVAEVVLGIRVLTGPPTRWLTWLQVAMVMVFTSILALLDPWLMVHPFGMLTKNIPFLGLVVALHLAASEGWTPRAQWALRGGIACIWITEGLFPKVLFQQPMELAVVANSGLVPGDPSVFLVGMGAAQMLTGIGLFTLRGAPLRWLLSATALALVVLPVLVSWQEPLLWVHPFGPMTKNIPIFIGTVVAVRQCSR